VTGGTADLQEIEIEVMARDFDIGGMIILAARSAFHGGH
jgi:hypothetical protein